MKVKGVNCTNWLIVLAPTVLIRWMISSIMNMVTSKVDDVDDIFACMADLR